MNLNTASDVSAFPPGFALVPAMPRIGADPVLKASANALALAQSIALLLPASGARACERLHAIAAAWAADGPVSVAALRDRLRAHCERFESLEAFATETARQATEARCERTYALSQIRITRMPPRRPLLERAAPRPLEAGNTAELKLRMALVGHFLVTLRQGEPHFGGFLRTVLRFLRRRQAVLHIAAEARFDLDYHLGAGAAARALGSQFDEDTDFGDARGLPNLLADLQDIFDLRIAVDARTLDIEDRM
jgi:hypothetical protein